MTTGTVSANLACHIDATVSVTNKLHEALSDRDRTGCGRDLADCRRRCRRAFAQHQGAPDGAVATTADEALVATIPLGFQQRLVHDRGEVLPWSPAARLRHGREPARTHPRGGASPRPAARRDGPACTAGAAASRPGSCADPTSTSGTRAPGAATESSWTTTSSPTRPGSAMTASSAPTSFERYDVRIDGPGREIRLYEPGRAVAGEDLGPPISMDDLGRSLVHFTVRVNGREMEAILDTGAPYTVLNTAAALLAGVELTGAPFSLLPRGIGSATIAAAPVRLTSLDLGTTRFAEVDALVAELAMFEALGLSEPPSTHPRGADRGGLRDPDLSGARVGLGLRRARPDRATSSAHSRRTRSRAASLGDGRPGWPTPPFVRRSTRRSSECPTRRSPERRPGRPP